MKTRQERTAAFEKIDLYPVTGQALSLERDNYQIVQGIIDGGAKIVQLREKHLSKIDLLVMGSRFREMTKKAGMLLIINDHIDVALGCGADGVHLGQDDLSLKAARALAPDLILGASTHNLDEALRAQADGADYVNIGPIFPTALVPVGKIGPMLT
jgi:thiamine-phosphate pyrophosphorylase